MALQSPKFEKLRALCRQCLPCVQAMIQSKEESLACLRGNLESQCKKAGLRGEGEVSSLYPDPEFGTAAMRLFLA